jgi:hypothetical protein
MAWQLLYFDAPTRGEQLRLLFKAAKTEFKDVRLEYPRGLDQVYFFNLLQIINTRFDLLSRRCDLV